MRLKFYHIVSSDFTSFHYDGLKTVRSSGWFLLREDIFRSRVRKRETPPPRIGGSSPECARRPGDPRTTATSPDLFYGLGSSSRQESDSASPAPSAGRVLRGRSFIQGLISFTFGIWTDGGFRGSRGFLRDSGRLGRSSGAAEKVHFFAFKIFILKILIPGICMQF